jgi:hypothetical protein
MSDYDLVIDNKHYDLKWTRPQPPTQKDVEGIVAMYRQEAAKTKPPPGGIHASSPLSQTSQHEAPKPVVPTPPQPAPTPPNAGTSILAGKTGIGPQEQHQPNMLQRSIESLGKVLGYPADVVKAGALLPMEEKLYKSAWGVDTRTPADKARVKQLQDMPLLKRASAMHGDPLRSLGTPEKEAQRQAADANLGPLAHGMNLLGGAAADLVTDPMTYLAGAGLAKAPAKVGKAISGAFAGQMIAPYIADPSKIKDDPQAFLLHLVMAGTAATHALGHAQTPKPGSEGLSKETLPDIRESPLRTRSVKPSKSPKLSPEGPTRSATERAEATHRANLLKQEEAARTAQENAESQARRVKANPQAKPQRVRPVDPKQAEAKAKSEAQAKADAEYAAWTRQHPTEAAGPVKPVAAKPKPEPADTFPRTIRDRYGIPRDEPPEKGGSAPIVPKPVEPKPPSAVKPEAVKPAPNPEAAAKSTDSPIKAIGGIRQTYTDGGRSFDVDTIAHPDNPQTAVITGLQSRGDGGSFANVADQVAADLRKQGYTDVDYRPDNEDGRAAARTKLFNTIKDKVNVRQTKPSKPASAPIKPPTAVSKADASIHPKSSDELQSEVDKIEDQIEAKHGLNAVLGALWFEKGKFSPSDANNPLYQRLADAYNARDEAYEREDLAKLDKIEFSHETLEGPINESGLRDIASKLQKRTQYGTTAGRWSADEVASRLWSEVQSKAYESGTVDSRTIDEMEDWKRYPEVIAQARSIAKDLGITLDTARLRINATGQTEPPSLASAPIKPPTLKERGKGGAEVNDATVASDEARMQTQAPANDKYITKADRIMFEKNAEAAKPAIATTNNVRVANVDGKSTAFVKLPGGGEMRVELPQNAAAKTKAIRDLQAKHDKPAGTRTGSRTSGMYRYGYLEGSPADEFQRAKQQMRTQIAEAAGAASKELPKVVGAAGASQQSKQGENNATQEGLQQANASGKHQGNGQGGSQTGSGSGGRVRPAAQVQGEEVGAGIRHKTLQAIAKKYGLPEIPRGPGTSTKEMVEFGQEAIKHGADPEAHLQAALGRGPVSGFSLKESAAVVRGHLEHLQSEVNRLGDEAKDHPQLKGLAESAKSKYQDFAEKAKEIGTEVFHGVGMTMQGETDIDTGSFTAVSRAYQERNTKSTGRAELTPFETANAERLTNNVKTTRAAATKAADALNKQMKGEAVMKGKARSEKVPSDPVELGQHIAKKLADYQRRKIELGAVGASSRPNPAWSAADRAAIWDHAKANYIDAGHDYESTLRNTATDLGISADDVRRIFESDTRTRQLAADFFAAMNKMRTAQRKAQSFIDWGNKPDWERVYDMTLGIPRNTKIYGHGGVMMFTHAVPNLFDPMTTASWFRNFGRSWGYWFNPGFHEKAMMKIERDPLFPVMDKAGLAVNPNKTFDDYHMFEGISDKLSGAKNAVISGIGKGIETVGGPFIRFGESGNRGADALKSWRFETFKKIWNGLPTSIKDPGFNNKLLRAGSRKLKTASDDIRNDGMAEQIAEWVNHASGHARIGDGSVKKIAGKVMFSPGKFGSTWARVVGDPIKTLNGVRKMALGTSTPEEAYMTTFRVKRAARLSSVFLGALYANDKFQEARKSSNRVNFTQPWKSDWLHFKAGDRQLDPTGGTLGPLHLLGVGWATATGRMPGLHGEGEREAGLQAGMHYLEGQATPGVDTFLSTVYREDFMGRPLPWSRKPGTPAKPKYTYREWLLEQLPIPIQESVQSVYDDYRRHGMSESEADKALGSVYAFGLAMVGVRDMPATRPAPVRMPALPRNPDIPRTRINTRSDFKD